MKNLVSQPMALLMPMGRRTARQAAGIHATIFAASLLIFVSQSSAQTVFVETGGQVVVEAEHFTSRTADPSFSPATWSIVPAEASGFPSQFTNYRGDGYIQALPDVLLSDLPGGGLNNEPYVDYTLRLTTTGTYRLYVRWDSHDNNSDSFYAVIVELSDGVGGSVPDWYRYASGPDDRDFATRPWHGIAGFERTDAIGGEVSAVWNITNPGDYTLRFYEREDGAAIDAFILQITSLLPPAGNGPPESGTTVATMDQPPMAEAGTGFSVNEGQLSVMLDGTGSSDPDGDPLTYFWLQVGGTAVTLSNPSAAQPTFDAPLVALGGETLTFELTVTANGESDVDTVDVTVVNVNHPPIADAGDDQSIAEGALVTLHGEDSFDVDADNFTYSWIQVSGSTTVTLTGANTANPTFNAPFVAAGGAPGVVATLVFELTVDDGFPQDAPAPGYSFANVTDSVTVEVTNLNNDPAAEADDDQTVDENSPVTLNASGSSDPDGDPLTFTWAQTGGPTVTLSGDLTATPSFTAPFVSPGGEDLTFQLTVHDGFGGTDTDTTVVHVQNANDPPLISAAAPTTALLWPPDHRLVSIGITGVSDPDNNASITIDSVMQDEPTNGTGDGDTGIDAIINSDGTVLLRAERSGNNDGRVYHIHFTASDLEGSASGVVIVTVPHRKKAAAVDGGELHDSTTG